MTIESIAPFANIVQDLLGKKAAAVIDPIGRKSLKAEKKQKETAARLAATTTTREKEETEIIKQINEAAPEQVVTAVETQRAVIDDRARARRLKTGGKQSTILTGTSTRLKKRLGQ